MSSADLSDLVRVRGNTIAALVDDGAFFGEVYPAISYDDGGDWRINGPQFALAASCGPCTTDHLAVSSDGTVMAWGRGGDYVKTHPRDQGPWYAATIPGVRRARASGDRLVVHADSARSYASRDDGRTWELTVTTP